jgi:hypothetical protein
MRTGRETHLAIGSGVLLAVALGAAAGFDLPRTAAVLGGLVAVWAVLLSIRR